MEGKKMVRDGSWNIFAAKVGNFGIMLLFLLLLVPAECPADLQTLGDVATPGEGDLKIIVHGRMEVWRYVYPGEWQYQFFSEDSKDSVLQINGVQSSLGGYYNGDLALLVSNSMDQNGTRITTVYKAGDNDAQITQETTYLPGSAYYGLRWTIINISAATLEDLRFFHGGDTYFEGDDDGGGFWDAANNTIGVQHTSGDQISRMSLQGSTVPYSYESRNYSNVRGSVNAGALIHDDNSAAIDPNEETDNGYALEWRRATLGVGESWTIQAFEKFGDAIVGGPLVYAPTQTEGAPDSSVDLIFSVENTSPDPQSTAFSVTVGQTGWTAVVLSPVSPVSMAGSSTQQVVVRVTIPATAADGSVGLVTLEATANLLTSTDDAAVKVKQPVYYEQQAATAGTGVGSYRLVSVPLRNVAGDLAAAVASGVPANWTFGAQGDIRIFRWLYNDELKTSGTDELTGDPAHFSTAGEGSKTDLAGQAFWRIVRKKQAFNYSGDAVIDSPFTMELHSGWNVFGFPFSDTAQISTDNLLISNNGIDYTPVTDPAQTIAGHSIWEYEDRNNDGDPNDITNDSTLYDRAQYIVNGYGYFIYVNPSEADGTVTLQIRNIERVVTSTGRSLSSVRTLRATGDGEEPPPDPPAIGLESAGTAGASDDGGNAGGGGGCFIAAAASPDPAADRLFPVLLVILIAAAGSTLGVVKYFGKENN